MFNFSQLPVPLITFLVAFGDALFPVNIFIPGEPAFLFAGFEFGSGNGYHLLVLVYIGAYIGDQCSYLLGRLYGPKLFNRVKHPKRRRLVAHGRLLIRKRGASFVFISRFLGPVCWVTQAMAGAYKLNYGRYMLASAAGVICGVSQFVAFGYLSAIGVKIIGLSDLYESAKSFAAENVIITILIVTVLFTIVWKLQKVLRNKLFRKKLHKVS